MSARHALPSALTTVLALLAPPARAAARLPVDPGELVATSRPVSGSLFVVTLMDIRDPDCNPDAALGVNWLAPLFHNEMPNRTNNMRDEWTSANLGFVYGLALDDSDQPSIFVSASSAWGLNNGILGSGRIYRLDGLNGSVNVFATLPNTGPGFGNIAFDHDHQQFFVTNHEDGRIYRLARSGAVLDSFDPFAPDDGTDGFAPLGERLWAVGVDRSRVYFSVWAEDGGRPTPGVANTIWSVGLDPATGAFVAADLTLEIVLPPLGATGDDSEPVADMAFADDQWLVVAERSMQGDAHSTAHAGRVLEYRGDHLAWVQSSRSFVLGFGADRNSCGGVDFDNPVTPACNTGRRVWAMGDAIESGLYGVAGLPEAGGDAASSYIVDLDNNPGAQSAKASSASLDVRRCWLTAIAGDPLEFCGEPATVTLDARRTWATACTAAIEYRWLEGSNVLQDWSGTATLGVTPSVTTSYQLEARCGRCPSVGHGSVTITILPAAAPASLGNTLLAVRAGVDVLLSWIPDPAAASYVLRRGTVPGAWPGAPLSSGLPGPAERLLDEVPGPPSLYLYRVAGVSCSGAEGT